MTPEKDRLLRRLGALAASRQTEDSQRAESDPVLEREMRVPLDAQARSRIVQRLEEIVTPSSTANERTEVERLPASWVRRRQSWLRLAAAATVTVALMSLAYRGWQLDSGRVSALALPAYELAVEGQTQTQRGEVGSVTPGSESRPDLLSFAPGNLLTVTLRPRVEPDVTVDAQVYLARGSGWEPVDDAALQISARGAVRYETVIGEDVAVTAGTATLMVVVAAAGQLPDAGELSAVLPGQEKAAGEGWEAWVIPYLVSAVE